MINMKLATGRVIASESTALFDAADNALLSSARMTVTLLEAAAETRIDPRTKQKLLEAINAGQSKLVDSRKSFTSLHSQLVVLQRRTNLAEVSWGCEDARGAVRTIFLDSAGTDGNRATGRAQTSRAG